MKKQVKLKHHLKDLYHLIIIENNTEINITEKPLPKEQAFELIKSTGAFYNSVSRLSEKTIDNMFKLIKNQKFSEAAELIENELKKGE